MREGEAAFFLFGYNTGREESHLTIRREKNMIRFFILAVCAGLALAGGAYSGSVLEELDAKVQSAWEETDTNIRKQAEIIPPMAAVIRRYASHEKDSLLAAERAGEAALAAKSRKEEMKAADQMAAAAGRLLVAADAYPTLRSHPDLKEWRGEWESAGNALAVSRQDYNNAVREYNAALRRMPETFYAGLLGFEEAPYFKGSL